MEIRYYKSPTSESYLLCRFNGDWIEHYHIIMDYLEVEYGKIFNYNENQQSLLKDYKETTKEDWDKAVDMLYLGIKNIEYDY